MNAIIITIEIDEKMRKFNAPALNGVRRIEAVGHPTVPMGKKRTEIVRDMAWALALDTLECGSYSPARNIEYAGTRWDVEIV